MAAVVCVGLSQAVISAAITVASPGDTVRVPSGASTWTTPLTVTKRIKLIGAGVGQTVITSNTGTAGTYAQSLISYIATDAVSADYFRLSGFTFDANDASMLLYIDRVDTLTPTWVRIDHNLFIACSRLTSPAAWAMWGNIFGVVDHNELRNRVHLDHYGMSEEAWAAGSYQPGTANTLYWEDNNFSNQTVTVTTGGYGTAYCFRYNDLYLPLPSTGYYAPVWDTHGNQEGGDHAASQGAEFYGNKLVRGPSPTGGVTIYSTRGGKSLFFFNKMLDPLNCGPVSVNDDVTDSICANPTAPDANPPWPATPQRPSNSYYWNNRQGASGTNLYGAQIGSNIDNLLAEDTSFWVQKVPFNGSVGMGCGTLAQRNAITPTAVGVGWWLTDQDCTQIEDKYVGARGADKENISGTLYRWNGSSWELYFTPYTYPHPFVTEVQPTQAAVQEAVDAASPGDTIYVAAGTEDWSQPVIITKRLHLIGAGIGQTVITNTSGAIGTALFRYAPTDAGTSDYSSHFRLSGFTLDDNNLSYLVQIERSNVTSKLPHWIRLDHIRFIGGTTSFPVVIGIYGPFFGVVDHCVFVNWAHQDTLGDNRQDTWAQTSFTPGTINNLYYEDNTFEQLTQAPVAQGTAQSVDATHITFAAGTTGVVAYNVVTITGGSTGVGQSRFITSLTGDVATVSAWTTLPTGVVTYEVVRQALQTICSGGQSGRYAYRYNTFTTDARYGSYVPLFDAHGNGPGAGGNTGHMGLEIYGNKFASPVGGDFLDLRGAKAMVFFNKLTGVAGTNAWYAKVQEEYADEDLAIHHAADGTPMRVNNAYYWNNRFGISTFAQVVPYIATNVGGVLVENDCFWKQVESGFDGSVGMGCGPLASRPASASAVGVGYWATDQTCGGVSDDHVGVNPTTPITGTLYKWNGSTWEGTGLYAPYIPFTYPHPFTAGS